MLESIVPRPLDHLAGMRLWVSNVMQASQDQVRARPAWSLTHLVLLLGGVG